jgi:hypothetical protein
MSQHLLSSRGQALVVMTASSDAASQRSQDKPDLRGSRRIAALQAAVFSVAVKSKWVIREP